MKDELEDSNVINYNKTFYIAFIIMFLQYLIIDCFRQLCYNTRCTNVQLT